MAPAKPALESASTKHMDDGPINLPIEDSLDLHTFAPRDVATVVGDYLAEAHRHGFTEVRLIHGRGIGVQRAIVRAVLARHPSVEDFADGWGATLVRLKRGCRGPR
jgi:DNA-nicking Smr family endonuclease